MDKQSNRPSLAAAAAENRVPESVPFQCCIKEYGVRTRRKAETDGQNDCEEADEEDGRDEMNEDGEKCPVKGNLGWERRWRMWGVTIT